MSSGLTLAGGSTVARTAVGYRPTTELIRHAGGEETSGTGRVSSSPWSQRKKTATAHADRVEQPLAGKGSTHSNPSTLRDRSAKTPSIDSPTKKTVNQTSTREQTLRSTSLPRTRKLLTPPKRRLVVKTGNTSATKQRDSTSPMRPKGSPVKQKLPSIVISTDSKASSDEEDLTSLGASLHSKQSHCLVGIPKKTSQALRLLRILLNQPNLRSVTKLYVNQAIQKHMHILKELQTTRQSKQILETQLEIAKTDSDIAKAASAAAEQRLKSVKWKLAKERQVTKDKLSAAAATIAMSSSIAPNSASTANLTEIVSMVEKTVLSLRAKEKVLRQLNGNADNDETTAMVEQLEFESKLLRQHLDPDGQNDDDDNDSDSTPVMGHQSFSSLDSSKCQEEAEADKTPSNPKEIRQLKRDFGETIAAAERKIDQLKSVLAVCNERRLRAEEFLDESQKEALIQFTVENQEQLAHNTSPLRSNHGNGIVVEKAEIACDIEDDLESSQMVVATEVSEEGNEALLKELHSVKEKLQKLENESATLTRETTGLTNELQLAKTEAKQHENKVVDLESALEETERKVFDLLLIGKEQAFEEKQLRIENLTDDLAHATTELQSSKERVITIETKLEETKEKLAKTLDSMDEAIRKRHETQEELDETKDLLNAVRIELKALQEIKQPRQKILDSRSAVRQAEARVGEIRARILRPHHSADSPGKVRSRVAAFERRASDVSTSDRAKADEILTKTSFDGVSVVEVKDFSDASEVVMDEMPTEQEMVTDTEKIATIQRGFIDSAVPTIQDVGSMPSSALLIEPEAEEKITQKDMEIVELRRQLEEKSQKLINAEKKIALFQEETKKDSCVERSQEEINELKQKVLSSTEELNEANGKLIFLRKVVLSVVPWEDDADHEDSKDYEEA